MPTIQENLIKAITIMEAVPDNLVRLNTYKCGAVACLAGHLAQDPYFIEQGLTLVRDDADLRFYPMFQGRSASAGDAVDTLLGEDTMENLFSARWTWLDEKLNTAHGTDKEAALARLRWQLDKYGGSVAWHAVKEQ